MHFTNWLGRNSQPVLILVQDVSDQGQLEHLYINLLICFPFRYRHQIFQERVEYNVFKNMLSVMLSHGRLE